MNKSISLYLFLIFIIAILASPDVFGQLFTGEYEVIGEEFFGGEQVTLYIDDINLDGSLDFVLKEENNTIRVRSILNEGNNKLLINEPILLAGFNENINTGSVDIIQIGDIDNDGCKDLTYSFQLAAECHKNFCTGEGSGSTPIPIFLSDQNSGHFALADINEDGFLDIISTDYFEKKISWHPNIGSGTFDSRIPILELPIGPYNDYYVSIFPFDIDQDEDQDILLISDQDQVSILRNEGGSIFKTEEILVQRAILDKISNVHFEDINNDGLKDLIFEGGVQHSWIAQVESEKFGPPQTLNGINLSGIHQGAFADFDNDGDIDYCSPEENFGIKISWYENDGLGNFTEHILASNFQIVGDIIGGDIDGDGDQDIIAYINNQGIGSLILFENLLGSSVIQGCAFYDQNENGFKEDNENSIGFIKPKLNPGSVVNFRPVNDCFSYIVEDGIYNLSYQSDPNWELTSDSSSYTVNVNGDSHSDLNFGFTPTEIFMAGQMHSVSGITRCNRDTKFDFTFQNQGTTVITEGIIWAFPDSLLQIGKQIDPLDTLVNDYQWGWKFTNLYPGETIQRSIELSIPGISDEVEPGTLLEIFSATEATNTQGFVNFFKFNYAQPILCAYDPNDKLISPDREGEENYTLFEDTLIYTVRFQNTGNDTAFTVVVRDTLDESLNVETFNILATSHREILRAEIKEDKYVTFTFENILLPDSTVNFNGSQGYVSYSIQTKDGLDENTIVENTASIYFDFNPPIVTNTTQNTLVECLPITAADISVTIQEGESYTLPDGMVIDAAGVYTSDILNEEGCPIETIITLVQIVTAVDELAWDNLVSISPNPTQDIFHLDINTSQSIDHTIQINDILGKEVQSTPIQSKRNRIDIEVLISGTYFVQVREKDGTLIAVKKLILL